MKKVETEAEIETLAALAKEIWEQHFTPLIGEKQVAYMLKRFQSKEPMTKQIEEDGYEYYFITEENTPIGYTAIALQGEKMFLSKLYIKLEYRGQGHSKRAMQFIKERCKEEKVKSLYLTCNKGNEGTLKVYDKMGFKIIDDVVTDIGEGYVMDDYILELAL